jgi:hypothetical protein
MLKVQLPTTLPTAMSRSPLMAAAMMDVATSGSEVPAATMVRPITRSLTPMALAKHRCRDQPVRAQHQGGQAGHDQASCTGSLLSQAPGVKLRNSGQANRRGGLDSRRDCTIRKAV